MTTTKILLNRYMVEMVNPDKCIRNVITKWTTNESKICDRCFLRNGDDCEYETVVVDYAKGEYESEYDNREISFEQFCCPKCGELISQHSTRHIEWKDIECKHCKAEYVCLKDDYKNEKLTLARKVN
jgi:hypothetical protein